MTTFAEIKAAADSLPADQKQELFLFLAARLRGAGQLPSPVLSPEQIEAWIAAEEAGTTRFKDGR